MMKKRLVILGATGSIGESALRVVAGLKSAIEVTGLTAGRRAQRLAKQARQCGCRWVMAADPVSNNELQGMLPDTCRCLKNDDELNAAVTADDVDIVLCAIVGTAGLIPVLNAIRAGKDIALASKEILVMAGELVMAEARRCGVRILPVDSEHSAIFQALSGHSQAAVRRLILTASGGPFRELSATALAEVTPARALAHPTWSMGPKVTLDSATMMNKGLELIEARWLFDIEAERIDVVLHPQSIIHSMVEFVDGSILAQMSNPDMCLPIQYALTCPERYPGPTAFFDLTRAWNLELLPPDHERFPAIHLAVQALNAGGTAPAVLNAANEVAVAAFMASKLSFPGIWRVVKKVLEQHQPQQVTDLPPVLEADAAAREAASALINSQ